MKGTLFIILIFSSLNLIASTWHPKDYGRFEFSANPMQSGDAFEFGYSTKSLFKLKKDSRHFWSMFGSVGTLTYSNALIKGESKSGEIISPEVILGIQAHANFLKDFLFQYGKVGIDTIFYDESLNEDIGVGLMLETGIELKSDIEKMSFHLGFRWRVGLPNTTETVGELDPFEGISIVFGSRFFF